METFLGGLALAGVTALTYIAYKHHDRFPIVAALVAAACTLVLASAASWSIGFNSGPVAAFQHVRELDSEALLTFDFDRVNEIGGFDPTLFIYGSFGLTIYVLVLLYVPPILGLGRKG